MMKKIKVGIVGYGNLGKAVEELLSANEKYELVCVFSARDIAARFCGVDKTENLQNYYGKIDILFLCGGSSSNLIQTAKIAIKRFNTIDAFDMHNKIKKYIKDMNFLAKKSKKVAFCCFGWDPGLFSLMRALFLAMDEEVFTTWGKGISQGHSEAIRNIPNVEDAVQYTIPCKKVINKIKKNQEIKNLTLHKRECLVMAKKQHQKQIKDKIVNMPNYFKGYETKVKFVKRRTLNKNKKLFHKGEVFTKGGSFGFYLKTKSNPHLTAKIMLTYATALINFKRNKNYGAYSILDVPIEKLINKDNII